MSATSARIVELAVPSCGHGSRSAQFDAFYRDRRISIRRRGRHEAEQILRPILRS